MKQRLADNQNFERFLTALLGDDGLNADWSVSAWLIGLAKKNSAEYWVLDNEDRDNTYSVVCRAENGDVTYERESVMLLCDAVGLALRACRPRQELLAKR